MTLYNYSSPGDFYQILGLRIIKSFPFQINNYYTVCLLRLICYLSFWQGGSRLILGGEGGFFGSCKDRNIKIPSGLLRTQVKIT
jgi:hypothetical protein